MFLKRAGLINLMIISVLLLSACAAAQTDETPTDVIPDSVDLTDLESLSFIPGDLPDGFAVSKAVRTLPEIYFPVTNFSDMIYYPIEKNLLVQGGLYIFLFDDNSDRDNAYQLINQELGKRADILKLEMQPVSGIGEQASMLSVKGSSIGIALNVVELVFEHCGAVVNLSLGDESSLEKVESLVTSYAGRLANRLDTLSCQQN
jgi:hypothetical protein